VGVRANVDDVADVLAHFVNAKIAPRGRRIGPEDDLERAGVDSMGLLKILLFVEAEYGFWMPDDDLVEDNVSSLAALARYICLRRPLS
jgi:acyl carrier protein